MEPVRSLSLGSTSDLVVGAPWKGGLIEADEPILPRHRLARTFQTIFALRRYAREATATAAFADPIERLEQIHSFRLAAEDAEMRLSVTFDFGWEGYMRALWSEAGPFLDLLCCHCKGYRLARDAPLDDWRQWIRDHQRQSDYFYSATALTVGDLAALSQCERIQREQADGAAADRMLAGFRSRSAAEIAGDCRARAPREAVAQAIRVITVMYRLTRFWTADVSQAALGADAATLVLATRGMIEGSFVDPGSLPPSLEDRFGIELAWYRQKAGMEKPSATVPPVDPADIQRGVLKPFDRDGTIITHGAAVFLAVKDPAAARQALAAETPASEAAPSRAGTVCNIAFTFPGLQRLGMPPTLLAKAPLAFRDGAAARAGIVGDVRDFHPANWRPLRRNWSPGPDWTIPAAQVDVLVQLRTTAPASRTDLTDSRHPLHSEVVRLAGLPGLELLAVEALAPASPGGKADHLGFADGLSQPTLDHDGTGPWSDLVEPDALLFRGVEASADPFWRDGSFLAVRRMPIDRPRFDALLAADASPALRDPDLLAAKLLGRMRDGRPLAAAYGLNDFTYDDDASGAVCPLDSHVRRANPRTGHPPRIMRRGMSFGPPVTAEPDRHERGTFFMAYCGDLAEQYERVLGWVNGGNSTRVGSYLGDPLTGAPEGAGGRTYRFLHAGQVHRVKLPDRGGVIGLSWSLYLFAPTLSALRGLAAVPQPGHSWASQVERGSGIIDALRGQSKEAWRAVLNEPAARERGDSAAVWAAIRARYGGVLATPVGYCVGSHALVMEVLRDRGERFSNAGAGKRMGETIGPFHLGMDPCTRGYAEEAEPANTILASVTADTAFGLARDTAKARLTGMLTRAPDLPLRIDLLKELIEPVLGQLGAAWFDVPDGRHLVSGAQDWSPVASRTPRFPGDFWSPSRYTFNPFTSAETERLAKEHGPAIVAAAGRRIADGGRTALKGTISAAMAKQGYVNDADLARVLVGCMIGGVPTVAGNAARVLDRLVTSGELERLQRGWLLSGDHRHGPAQAWFGEAIARIVVAEPVPELLWREAATDDVPLGGYMLRKGERVIFSLESASQDQLAQGICDTDIAYGRARDGAPTAHGCPAHGMAEGIVLGLVAGLAEAARFTFAAKGMAELRSLG